MIVKVSHSGISSIPIQHSPPFHPTSWLCIHPSLPNPHLTPGLIFHSIKHIYWGCFHIYSLFPLFSISWCVYTLGLLWNLTQINGRVTIRVTPIRTVPTECWTHQEEDVLKILYCLTPYKEDVLTWSRIREPSLSSPSVWMVACGLSTLIGVSLCLSSSTICEEHLVAGSDQGRIMFPPQTNSSFGTRLRPLLLKGLCGIALVWTQVQVLRTHLPKPSTVRRKINQSMI